VHNICVEGEVTGSLYETTPATIEVDSNGVATDLLGRYELGDAPGPYINPPAGPLEIPEKTAGKWAQLISAVLSHNWHQSIFGH
jgi:hypothetical protein